MASRDVSGSDLSRALPTELYTAILQYLDCQSLLACMQVCSLFRDLIVGNTSLQYIIELVVAKQRDGKSCNASSAERLELLKRHQSAWKTLQWSREVKIPMENGGLWELYGGVLGQSKEDGTILFHQLPSDLRSIDYKTWTLGPDFGMVVRDFAMDPSQDLLVLVENPDWSLQDSDLYYRVHLRSLSTGKPHPHAAHTTLPLLQVLRDLALTYTIQIAGNLVAILFNPSSTGENEIAVWDWKNGSLLMDIYSDDILSFSFLSDRWIILSVIDMYGCPCLAAVDFIEEPSMRQNLDSVTAVFIFGYPDLHQGAFISDIDIRSDPGTLSQTYPTAPFSEDPKEFLLTVSIWLFVNGALRSLVHFIPSSHLLSCVNPLTPLEANDQRRALFWSDWGPDKTRMLFTNQNPSDIWVCYVSGVKFAISELQERKPGYSARVYDFRRLALERDARKIDGPPEGINLSPTVIKSEKAFDSEVSTYLPYRTGTITLEDAHVHCTVLCSEDNIIVVDSVENIEFWCSDKLAMKMMQRHGIRNRSQAWMGEFERI